MAREKKMDKILVIGPGPAEIGQGAEYDAAAVQALRALRERGYKTIAVNADPAAVMSDIDQSDRSYIEPLTSPVLTEIIAEEQPDALLTGVGGQCALNLTCRLAAEGVLQKHRVIPLGISVENIIASQHRSAFKKMLQSLGINTPHGLTFKNAEDAEQAADEIGYPLAVRSFFTSGGAGSGMAYNVEELRRLAERALSAGHIEPAVMLERSLLGWTELELVLLRDNADAIRLLAFIENIDAVGIHSGNSVCVTPAMTLDNTICAGALQVARTILSALDVAGCATIKLAVDARHEAFQVLAVDPRWTRSASLAAKATGLPAARFATRLAAGEAMDVVVPTKELPADPFQSSTGQVVVKRPIWDDAVYKSAQERLGLQMTAVGEAIGIGRTFREAFEKASRAGGCDIPGPAAAAHHSAGSEQNLMHRLGTPSGHRYYDIAIALQNGMDNAKISQTTGIHPWYINELQQAVADGPQTAGMSPRTPAGRIDQMVASKTRAAQKRSTDRSDKTILLLGSGPTRIGQSLEFDYAASHALRALKQQGCKTVVVDCNPKSLLTDPGAADRFYLEPLTKDAVLSVCRHEQPQGVVVQFGGAAALDLSQQLAQAGWTVLGTAAASIATVRSRHRLHRMIQDLGIPQPEAGPAADSAEAERLAAKWGYPIVVYLPAGQAGEAPHILHDRDMLTRCLDAHFAGPHAAPVLVERFLEYAIEAGADVLSDGRRTLVPAIVEHVELAGVHAADAACVVPPVSTPPRHTDTMRLYAAEIARALNIVGLMNILFAVYQDTVYVLEVFPAASRTVPLVSRCLKRPLASFGLDLMMGRPLSELDLPDAIPRFYSVKEAVFPFRLFPDIDPLLGPQTQSTGLVMGIADSYGLAFYKSQQAAGVPLPLKGTVLITVTDEDKPSILEPARRFRELGFKIMATRGTRHFLVDHGIEAQAIRKLGFGRPDIVDAIKNGDIQLVVNTPSGKQSHAEDAYIRKTAIRCGVPDMTTPAAAGAAVKAIAARLAGASSPRALQVYYGI